MKDFIEVNLRMNPFAVLLAIAVLFCLLSRIRKMFQEQLKIFLRQDAKSKMYIVIRNVILAGAMVGLIMTLRILN